MGKKKKCPECPPPGAPAYMLTYGDMMTLLVTFFVLLISFSTIQEAKFLKAISSLKGAFGVMRMDKGVYYKATEVPAFEFSSEAVEKEVQKVLEEAQQSVEKAGMQDDVWFDVNKDRIHFSISSPMLFTPGSATLKSEAGDLLDEIGEILALVPFEVRVEGHTDADPISTGQFPSNWELSGSRAAAIVRRFVESGSDPSRFITVGFGEFRPVASNDTEEGKTKNRRVEIYVNLKQDVTQELLPGGLKMTQ